MSSLSLNRIAEFKSLPERPRSRDRTATALRAWISDNRSLDWETPASLWRAYEARFRNGITIPCMMQRLRDQGWDPFPKGKR